MIKGGEKMYVETQCNSCKLKSINQPIGDGCHACNKGIMIKR